MAAHRNKALVMMIGMRTMPKTLSLIAFLLLATSALAQNPQAANPTSPTVPMAPPSASSPPPEKIAPPSGNSTNSHSATGDTSSRLSRQGGTITPPNVDPGMTVTPPRTGAATTPVIPPPGSPGGNSSVIPK